MNWQNFFNMGGFAFYVWGSFSVALALMAAELVLLQRRRKTLLRSRRKGGKVTVQIDHEAAT